jgi:uncharacterized membrane-anchored protein
LGASFADWAGKSRAARGLGYGDGPVSFLLVALIVVLVGYLTVARSDVQSAVVVPLRPGVGDDPTGR